MNIRPALLPDFEAIYAIWLEGIAHSFAGFDYPADLHEQFHHNFAACRPPFGFWVAETDGKVVGWQSLLPCTSNPMKRHLLAESSTYVASGKQTRGVGEALLRHALAQAGPMGLQFVFGYVLAGNERMAKLVQRCGFALASDALTPRLPPFQSPKDLWIYTTGPISYDVVPPTTD